MTLPVPFFDLSEQHQKLGNELSEAFSRVLGNSGFILGSEVTEFEKEFAAYTGTSFAIGVNSGLDALTLSLRALGVGPGDEVILPANSFIATALAASAVGATPVFADVDADYLLTDPASVKELIGPKTKAVIPVHLYGQSTDMEALEALCRAHSIPLIEDACQAHGARERGRCCGSLGTFGCFSFYPSKNLGALGDGGMITTDDKTLYERVLRFRNYGSIVKYRHEVPGFNTRLDGVQAAFLRAKLPHLDSWNEKRRTIAAHYKRRLSSIKDLRLPAERAGCEPVYHLYVIRTSRREELQNFLKDRQISTAIHYPSPIHRLEAYASLPQRSRSLSVCETQAPLLLSLPMYPELAPESVDRVCDAILEFFR